MKALVIMFVALVNLLCMNLGFATETANWQPQMVMQVVGEDNHTERTIAWQTTNDVETHLILTDAKGKTQKYMPVEGKVQYDNLKNNTHTIRLTGLRPHSKYTYRLYAGDDLVSPGYELSTAKQGTKLDALIFGDAQSFDYGVWGATAKAALTVMPKPDLFICAGDQVDNGERLGEWRGWYKGAAELITQIPAAPTLGNHETYGAKGGYVEPHVYKDFFPLPENGPQGLQGHAYTFAQGPARFFMLDTQAGEERAFHPDLLAAEAQWLDSKLSEAKEPWTIVVMHRSPWKVSGKRSAIGKALLPVLEKHRVALVFTGHTHIYERTHPINGTTYITTGRSGTKSYVNKPASQRNQRYSEYYFNPLDRPNFLTLEVRGRRATVSAYEQNGNLIDSFTAVR